MNPIVYDVILLVSAFAYVMFIIGFSLILKKKDKISGHAARKIVHLFAGFAVFIVPFLHIPFLALIVSVLVLLFIRISNPKNLGAPVFDMMAEKNEREVGYLSGPFSYALSINILVLTFSFVPRWFYFPAASIMVMMISDTLASMVGKRYGKHKIDIKYTKTVRSLEGSLTLFVSAFLLSLFAFTFFGSWFPNNSQIMTPLWIVILSLLLAGTSTIIEMLSPSNLDDLLVPITGCIITFGLTILLFPTSIGF